MLKGHVNASGFPLQIAVANAVNSTTALHGWKTRFSEHAWKHPETGESGFIDLVLCNQPQIQTIVIECKRVRETSWIFLTDESSPSERNDAKCFVFRKEGEEVKRFEWLDLLVKPITRESSYCIIPGTDHRSQSLIERTGSELVASTESLALEDKRLSLNDRWRLSIYFNMIVTTATLNVCPLNRASISLKDGTVGDVDFHEVPYVRFRKQLNPMYSVPELYKTFGDIDIARAKESTVFIVNSMHLTDFLAKLDIENGYPNGHYLA